MAMETFVDKLERAWNHPATPLLLALSQSAALTLIIVCLSR
jgi:hypothetical protein